MTVATKNKTVSKTPTAPVMTNQQHWSIILNTVDGQLYNGTYNAAEAKRAAAKIKSFCMQIESGKWKGGTFSFSFNGPPLPVPIKRS